MFLTTKKFRLLLFIFILGISINGYSAGEFLEIGVGSGALGTGEAFVGKSDDFSAPYWNPAGLSFMNNLLIGFHLSSYYESIYLNYISVIIPVEKLGIFGVRPVHENPLAPVEKNTPAKELGVIGLSSTYLTFRKDDLFLTEMDPSGAIVESSKTYSFFDFNLMLTYARKITGRIGVGGNFKYIYSRIEEEKASTIAIDAGLMIKHLLFRDLNFGFVLVNIGPGLKYIKKSENLPSAFKVGISKILLTSKDNKHKFIGLNDYIFPFYYNTLMFNTGLEYIYEDIFSLRSGYQYSKLKKQVSLGAGLNLKFMENYFLMNFVFLVPISELDNLMAFDLAIKF